MIRKSSVGFLFACLLLTAAHAPLLAAAVVDVASPRLPCGIISNPALPPPDAAPNTGVWTGEMLGTGWVPPACSGWQPEPTTVLIALAGQFTNGRDVSSMLAHVGAVSELHSVRYWSVTDKKWDALFTGANGLNSVDPAASRGDFSGADFRDGSDLYFLATDNRSQSGMVTRLHVKHVDAEHIVLELANVSPLRWLAFTLVPAGGMQTLYFLDRTPNGIWRFYSVTRIVNASFLFSALVTSPSYVNRAVAMYRHFADIPTDRDPPAMPN